MLGMERFEKEVTSMKEGSEDNARERNSSSDFAEDERTRSGLSSETSFGEEEGSPKKLETLEWPMQEKGHELDARADKKKPNVSDVEMMMERFSKLLLGEDMSGCGKGVCTALAISNAITNLCATIFGQIWRLEPLPPEKKSMWRREMEWLLCVSDHIVELIPTWQTFPDGSKLEVMTCRPRCDLHVNLPALRKLDNMLLEILDSFSDPEFWYVEQGISAPECDGSGSFRRAFHRHDEKWWLPVPHVPSGGLHEKNRKQLQYKREAANQILKAVMAINSNVLAEMDVPQSYLESLPKNGRACLEDVIYRNIISDQFSNECLLDQLALSSEHQALEIANHIEASIYVWRRPSHCNGRSSWVMVKDMITDAEKRELFAERAESLLICLKQRFPDLTQTTLDISKIQFNKDIGKSILESYSRVLESLASNIVARIDDLLYVDDLSKHSDQFSSAIGMIAHNKVLDSYAVPISGTPLASSYAMPCFSPPTLIIPAKEERTLLINRKAHSHGFSVKKMLTGYFGIAEVKADNSSNAK